MPHYPFLRVYLAPDAGGTTPTEDGAIENHEAEPIGQPETPQQSAQQTETQAAAQNAPATEGEPAAEQKEKRDTERAQDTPPNEEQTVSLSQRLDTMQAKLAETQLRSAAALAGVPKARIPYVMRMADVTGLDPSAADAAESYQKAVDKVLADVPELRAGAGTGSAGNFARKPIDTVDPDIERIKRNILG